MKKNLLFLCINLLTVNLSYGQQEELFLLAAHPFYDAPQFPSFLFRLNATNSSLDTVQQLSTDREVLREVKYYSEKRKIVLIKDRAILTANGSTEIQILSMDAKQKLESISLDSLQLYEYVNSWLFKLNNNESFFGIELYSHKSSVKTILLGYNIASLKEEKFQVQSFENAEISGNTGSVLDTFDGLAAYTVTKSGQLMIPETNDVLKRPKFSIILPKEYQFDKEERRLIVINNEKTFVFSLFNSPISAKDTGFTDLVILDKLNGLWFKQRLKGNYDGMIRSFDSWIAGTVFSDNKIFDDKGRLKGKINRLSEGKENRRRKAAKTGMPPDYRFDYYNLYSPGILYLLNVQTKNYIEWSTGQGDNEVLLVEKDQVYYRINDEIYRAPIVNGKKLGKAVLLIKNDMVPDIHWAFISNR